jgi:glycosyltransferase involved in cell wall biosynthesis
MNLIIVEVKAHNAGHYTQEINQFCKNIQSNFDNIFILTPYGFRDEWDVVNNCRVESLCQINRNDRALLSVILGKLYDYQWEFYKRAHNYISELLNDEYIIHVWDYTSIFPLWYFFRRFKKKKILNLKAVNRYRINLFGIKNLGKIQGLISNKLLTNFADKYIVHTNEISYEAEKIGIAKEKIYQIGIGVEEFSINLSQSIARSLLNLPNNIFIILFFGTIREEKGIYELFEHIKELNNDFILHIVGENKLSEPLTELIKKYNLETEIIIEPNFIPEQELEKYFKAADAVIICHRKEFKGESGVLLKALQYQTPIIASVGSNSARIVETENIGATFDISKPGNLINAITYIEHNKKQIESNLGMTKQKYSWKNIITSFQSLYFSRRV